MTKWRKVTNPDPIINTIGEVALGLFLKGEIFLINAGDKQTSRKLKDVTLFENRDQQHIKFWNRESCPHYLLVATYADGTRGIFYNNLPVPAFRLDQMGFLNRWELLNSVNEVFCYDDNKELFLNFLNLIEENTDLNDVKAEVYHYLGLNMTAVDDRAKAMGLGRG